MLIDRGEDRILAGGNTAGVLSADSAYCYRVLTRGAYTDPLLRGFGTLLNYAQIICATPADTARPSNVNTTSSVQRTAAMGR